MSLCISLFTHTHTSVGFQKWPSSALCLCTWGSKCSCRLCISQASPADDWSCTPFILVSELGVESLSVFKSSLPSPTPTQSKKLHHFPALCGWICLGCIWHWVQRYSVPLEWDVGASGRSLLLSCGALSKPATTVWWLCMSPFCFPECAPAPRPGWTDAERLYLM